MKLIDFHKVATFSDLNDLFSMKDKIYINWMGQKKVRFIKDNKYYSFPCQELSDLIYSMNNPSNYSFFDRRLGCLKVVSKIQDFENEGISQAFSEANVVKKVLYIARIFFEKIGLFFGCDAGSFPGWPCNLLDDIACYWFAKEELEYFFNTQVSINKTLPLSSHECDFHTTTVDVKGICSGDFDRKIDKYPPKKYDSEELFYAQREEGSKCLYIRIGECLCSSGNLLNFGRS